MYTHCLEGRGARGGDAERVRVAHDTLAHGRRDEGQLDRVDDTAYADLGPCKCAPLPHKHKRAGRLSNELSCSAYSIWIGKDERRR